MNLSNSAGIQRTTRCAPMSTWDACSYRGADLPYLTTEYLVKHLTTQYYLDTTRGVFVRVFLFVNVFA